MYVLQCNTELTKNQILLYSLQLLHIMPNPQYVTAAKQAVMPKVTQELV